MNAQALVVESFRALERAGEFPSVSKVRAMARAAGATFRNEQATEWLEKFVPNASELKGANGRFIARGPQRDSHGTDDGTDDGTVNHAQRDRSGDRSGDSPGTASRARTKGIPNRSIEPTDSTPTESRPKLSNRRVREPKALPELPAHVLVDYDRLVAADARERRDGRIADTVVAKNLRTLQLAFEKNGVEALEHGIDVALRRGLGVRFAAGCVRNYDGQADAFTRRVDTRQDDLCGAEHPALLEIWADPEHDAITLAKIAQDQRIADRINGIGLAS